MADAPPVMGFAGRITCGDAYRVDSDSGRPEAGGSEMTELKPAIFAATYEPVEDGDQ